MTERQDKRKEQRHSLLGFAAGAALVLPLGGIGYYFNEHAIGAENMAVYQTCTKTPAQCTTLDQWATTARVADQLNVRNQWQMWYLAFVMLGAGGFMGFVHGYVKGRNELRRECVDVVSSKSWELLQERLKHRREAAIKDAEIERLQDVNRRMRIGAAKAARAKVKRPDVVTRPRLK